MSFSSGKDEQLLLDGWLSPRALVLSVALKVKLQPHTNHIFVVCFSSERQQETSWLHPVTGRPVQTGHQAAPGEYYKLPVYFC